jgi:hypothetical protein
MTFSFFQYLLESSLCLLAFSLLYQLFFVRLTHFTWMRLYLLVSLLLSILLPFLDTVFQPLFAMINAEPQSISSIHWNTAQWLFVNDPSLASQSKPSGTPLPWLIYGLFLLYGSGVCYKSWQLGQSLQKIRKFIRLNHKEKEGQHWIVYVSEKITAFSFLHYIFIGKGTDRLPVSELQQIKQHELVHVRQKHTWDLLLVELIAIFFWFNPIVFYLKRRLQEVHEYLADEAVAGRGTQQKAYAHLLIKLAMPVKSIPLATSFSNKQIHNRITMLMKTRTLAQKKFYFLLLLPLIASLIFLFSCMEEGQKDLQSIANEALTEQSNIATSVENGKKIASIHWEGNTVYDDEKLNETLGLKPGDMYNEELINSRLNYNPELDDVSSLYMDNGYLLFNVNVNENQIESGTVNLVFDIYEGGQIKTDNIIIKGNQSVSQEEILQQIDIRSGEWFSRSKLIAAQRAIAEMGYFDPEKVNINPIPHPEEGTVDIEFILTEIQSKN